MSYEFLPVRPIKILARQRLSSAVIREAKVVVVYVRPRKCIITACLRVGRIRSRRARRRISYDYLM